MAGPGNNPFMFGSVRDPRPPWRHPVANLILAGIILVLLYSLFSGATDSSSSAKIKPPTITVNEYRAPDSVDIRFTNNDARTITLVHGSFALVDATGTVYPVDTTRTYWSGGRLPNYVELGTGESASGWLVFETANGTPPFSLRYTGHGTTVKVDLRSTP